MSQEDLSQENSPENQSTDQTAEPKVEDLDSLLSEFDAQTTETETNQQVDQQIDKKVDPDRLATLEKKFEESERLDIQRDVRAGLDAAVAQIKDLGELEMSDMQVEGYLHVMAAQDPRLYTAFNNRLADPSGFKKVLSSVAAKIKADAKQPDKKLTEDAEAVRAAVQGQGETIQQDAKTKTPQELRKMGKREFDDYKASLVS